MSPVGPTISVSPSTPGPGLLCPETAPFPVDLVTAIGLGRSDSKSADLLTQIGTENDKTLHKK